MLLYRIQWSLEVKQSSVCTIVLHLFFSFFLKFDSFVCFMETIKKNQLHPPQRKVLFYKIIGMLFRNQMTFALRWIVLNGIMNRMNGIAQSEIVKTGLWSHSRITSYRIVSAGWLPCIVDAPHCWRCIEMHIGSASVIPHWTWRFLAAVQHFSIQSSCLKP